MSTSRLEFHVLLALAEGPRHGFAIAEKVAVDSEGALQPRAGSLYRVISRLMSEGWVHETAGEEDEPHPGLPRRYYALTAPGRRTLRNEARALRHASAIALERLGESRS